MAPAHSFPVAFVTFSFNLHSALLLPFAVQGVLAGGALWGRGRRDESLADRLLGVFLVVLTLSVGQWLLGYAGWYDAHDAATTLMFYVPWMNGLAFGPLTFFYFRALTDQSFRLRGRDWAHFIPAIGIAALYPAAWLVDVGWHHLVRGEALPGHFGTKGALADWLQSLGWLGPLTYVSLAVYGTRTLRAYRAYQQYLDAQFSDTAQLRFQWVRRALLATMGAAALWLGFDVVQWLGVSLSFDELWFAYFGTGALIYYLSFAGLQAGSSGRPALLFQPAIAEATGLAGQMPTTADTVSAPTALAAATTAATTAPEIAEWIPRLLQLMIKDEPWREPELTLADLAHRLRVAPAMLSKIINAGTGQNFNDFVNAYRVAEAAARLRDPAFRHYTLLAVALEAGFNSKSTFNRVFKKAKGLTPSEFLAEPAA
ncbi:MAG: helix-turn-helix transcriptional regulator [Hymenobacteraceae bacterium]|nr:helix-turn-helix transcriptional regulator [Hymenobacteraceae bacterium]